MSDLVITQRLFDEAIARLDEAGIRYEYNRAEEPWPAETLREKLRGARGVICLLTDRITADLMDAAPELEIIANVAVGYDNVDVAAATERGILVTNTPDVLTETTADLAFALLLAVARRIPEGDEYMRAGRYDKFRLIPEMLGHDVYGKTLGIVGLGRIGAAVARRGALGFGMSVLYTARSRHQTVEKELGARHVAFETLLTESDFVSIHVPLTAETRHLFAYEQFRQMKPAAFLINTSRGPVVKEADLARALADRLIAGAALDVFEEEPQLHPDLIDMRERLVVAPHVGSATVDTRRAMALLAVDNALAFLRGERPPTPVNPEVLGRG